MFSEIKARLGLDISGFKAGMDQAKREVGKTAEGIQSLQSKLLGPIGAVIALTAGFSAALDRARGLREEAEELGFTLDENTLRVARMSDAFTELKNNLAQGTNWAISKLGQLGEWIGAQTIYLNERIFNGKSRAEVDAGYQGGLLSSIARGRMTPLSRQEKAELSAQREINKRKEALEAERAAREAERAAQEEANRLAKEAEQIEAARLKALAEEEALMQKMAEEHEKSLLEGERARLAVLQEQRAELEAQASAKMAALVIAQQDLALAQQRAVNPMGVTVGELAGMNPNDSRFGFTLKARRRIEQARESISLAQQARFAEIGGNSRLADRLSGESSSLEQAALSFRTPGGRGTEVAQIAAEVKTIARDIASINKSLVLLEVED